MRKDNYCECDVCRAAYGESAPTEGKMRDAHDADDANMTLNEYLST